MRKQNSSPHSKNSKKKLDAPAKARFQPADVRIDDLLSAAEIVLLKRGPSGLTIDEVVETAGVAKGTFYLYFKSKDELIHTLQGRFAQRFLGRLQELMKEENPKSDLKRLDSWVRCAWQANFELAKLHDLLFHGFSYQLGDEIISSVNALLDDLSELIAKGSQAKAWSAPHPRLTAIFLFNAFHGLIHAQPSKTGDIEGLTPKELILFTQKVFRRVVAPARI